jgi:hypothetical protein
MSEKYTGLSVYILVYQMSNGLFAAYRGSLPDRKIPEKTEDYAA